jgi:replicative DNA helicase
MTYVSSGPVHETRAMSEVVAAADDRLHEGASAGARPEPTGVPILDRYLGGGMRSGELILLGGPQGLGKTTYALQILRNVAARGGAALYFSFEHDHAGVLERLIAIEAAEIAGSDGITLRRVRQAMQGRDGRRGGLVDRLELDAGGVEAVQAILSYGDRLSVHRSSGATTSVATMRSEVDRLRERTGEPPLVVVDYLQKVHVPDGSLVEEERVTRIVEDLKDLAWTPRCRCWRSWPPTARA